MLPDNQPIFLRLLTRYHFIIALTISSALLIAEGWFLYIYFYQPLIDTRTLIELKQQHAVEEVQLPLYTKIKEFYETKQKAHPIEIGTLRDPFTSASGESPPQ